MPVLYCPECREHTTHARDETGDLVCLDTECQQESPFLVYAEDQDLSNLRRDYDLASQALASEHGFSVRSLASWAQTEAAV
jgi:hypothetical protein